MHDAERGMLGHFLGALAYRTQKALRGAPEDFATFSAGNRARTPTELLQHMTSLMGYATTLFRGGSYPRRPEPLASLAEEAARFHAMLEELSRLLTSGAPMAITNRQLLQGPLADAMTHVGQLAMLRRLAESPVAPENFIDADVRAERLGPDQPGPASPDAEWPEAPA